MDVTLEVDVCNVYVADDPIWANEDSLALRGEAKQRLADAVRLLRDAVYVAEKREGQPIVFGKGRLLGDRVLGQRC